MLLQMTEQDTTKQFLSTKAMIKLAKTIRINFGGGRILEPNKKLKKKTKAMLNEEIIY